MRRALAVWAVGLALLATVRPAAASNTTVNIEIDYMVASDHTHKPAQAAIDAVVAMFACRGITCNIVVDEALPETALLEAKDVSTFFGDANNDSTFQYIRSRHFNHAGQANWHYCLFGHDYQLWGGTTGSSGIAELPGYGFLVALGTGWAGQVGTNFDQAATLAHEFGHNLGLHHAGTMDENVVGASAIDHASIMSYFYQLRGVKTHMQCLGMIGDLTLFKDLDYSDGRLPNLNEAALDETRGIGVLGVDWNCNGSVSGTVAQDLEDPSNDGYWCGETGTLQVQNDSNDWQVVYNSLANPPAPNAVATYSEPCRPQRPDPLVTRPYRLNSVNACATPQPVLTTEACVQGLMVWVDPNYSGAQAGTGSQPYNYLGQAVLSAPAGSILYLQPGTHHSGTSVISTPLTLTGPQPVTIVP